MWDVIKREAVNIIKDTIALASLMAMVWMLLVFGYALGL